MSMKRDVTAIDNDEGHEPDSKRQHMEHLPPVSSLINTSRMLLDGTLDIEEKAETLNRIFQQVSKRSPEWKAVLDPKFVSVEHCEKVLAVPENTLLGPLDDCIATQEWESLFDEQVGLWRSLATQYSSNLRRVPPNDSDGLTERALESSWGSKYLGKYHWILFNNINTLALKETPLPYSKQITIIQSSGTGKSRMVHEQAKIAFTIPFNIRGDEKGLAFPKPDGAVRDYLTKGSPLSDERIITATYLSFLGNIFKHVADELRKHAEELNEIQIATAEQLAEWWSNHLELEDVRTELYAAAIHSTQQEIKSLDKLSVEHQGPPSESQKSLKRPHQDSQNADKKLAEKPKKALDDLIDIMDHYSDGSQKIKLIIYFDEAHSLTEYELPRSNRILSEDNYVFGMKTLYDILCSCLNHFIDSSMFVIFLSTNSSLAKFVPPQAAAKSTRVRLGQATIHAPITETPFDNHRQLKIGPGQLTLEETSKISYMARFGRPLFWTLLQGLQGNGPEERRFTNQVLELARTKLIAHHDIHSIETASYLARMAVLDVQLSLDFEPRREQVQVEEARLVESHMRIAYSVPEHREYLRSGYSSEPLLAEAAAEQLWEWKQKNPSLAVKTLSNIHETGLFDRGELGELTGRLLLLDAYHRACDSEQSGRPANTPPNFSAGCLLTNFLTELFSDNYSDLVLESTPDNVEGIELGEAFKDARVCFTHFGKMADSSGVTSTAAWVAFVRHMAIMCPNGQVNVDCIIPVLLKNTKICEHVMTGLLVQFKRRVQAGTIAKYTIDQEVFHFFPDTLLQCTHGSAVSPYRPYISLVMELGVQLPAAIPKNPSKETKPATTVRRKAKAGLDPMTPSKVHISSFGSSHYSKEDHARYNIFAYGCSPTVYRGISAEQKDSYALLLSSRDFIGEHPRKDDDSLWALRRAKPYWAQGDDTYHWVEYDKILHGSVEPPSGDFLVGSM